MNISEKTKVPLTFLAAAFMAGGIFCVIQWQTNANTTSIAQCEANIGSHIQQNNSEYRAIMLGISLMQTDIAVIKKQNEIIEKRIR